jgi:uncharacterized membrane-anchored protein YitT (DUF2179 family)
MSLFIIRQSLLLFVILQQFYNRLFFYFSLIKINKQRDTLLALIICVVSLNIKIKNIMVVAKWTVCKTKIGLQVGKICEETKCVNSVQQHLTAVKTNWTIVETRVNDIKKRQE